MIQERDIGLTALQRGDYEGAIYYLERAREADPTDFQILLSLGGAYHLTGRDQEAVRVLSQVVARHPDNAGAHYNLAVCLERIDRRPEAIRAVQLALSLQPDYPLARKALRKWLEDSGAVTPLPPAQTGPFVGSSLQSQTALQAQQVIDAPPASVYTVPHIRPRHKSRSETSRPTEYAGPAETPPAEPIPTAPPNIYLQASFPAVHIVPDRRPRSRSRAETSPSVEPLNQAEMIIESSLPSQTDPQSQPSIEAHLASVYTVPHIRPRHKTRSDTSPPAEPPMPVETPPAEPTAVAPSEAPVHDSPPTAYTLPGRRPRSRSSLQTAPTVSVESPAHVVAEPAGRLEPFETFPDEPLPVETLIDEPKAVLDDDRSTLQGILEPIETPLAESIEAIQTELIAEIQAEPVEEVQPEPSVATAQLTDVLPQEEAEEEPDSDDRAGAPYDMEVSRREATPTHTLPDVTGLPKKEPTTFWGRLVRRMTRPEPDPQLPDHVADDISSADVAIPTPPSEPSSAFVEERHHTRQPAYIPSPSGTQEESPPTHIVASSEMHVATRPAMLLLQPPPASDQTPETVPELTQEATIETSTAPSEMIQTTEAPPAMSQETTETALTAPTKAKLRKEKLEKQADAPLRPARRKATPGAQVDPDSDAPVGYTGYTLTEPGERPYHPTAIFALKLAIGSLLLSPLVVGIILGFVAITKALEVRRWVALSDRWEGRNLINTAIVLSCIGILFSAIAIAKLIFYLGALK